jgi:tetratricopeptide (TPR) repeat protein
MAKCRYCGRSGWFMSVTENGLCTSCNPIIVRDIVQRKKDIAKQAKAVNLPGKFENKVHGCDAVIRHLKVLADYERRGIPIRDLSPSSFLQEYHQARERILADGLEKLVSDGLARAEVARTVAAKIIQASRALIRLRDFSDQGARRGHLETLERKLKDFVHTTQLNAYLENANKAEFKGQYKKALDQFREALYFLKHDEIDDKLQAAHIGEIEKKIAELQSRLGGRADIGR